MPVRFWRPSRCRDARVGRAAGRRAHAARQGGRRHAGLDPAARRLQLQPGEAAKLALRLWGADLLVRKQKLLRDWRHLFLPAGARAQAALAALIMLQPDMGMTVALLIVVVALLWVAGTPLRYFGVLCAALVTLFTMLAVAAPYRMRRLTSFLDPFADAQDSGFQAVQSMYAIASADCSAWGSAAGSPSGPAACRPPTPTSSSPSSARSSG
jgi:cell division protein FtsW (lipid II flippase)